MTRSFYREGGYTQGKTVLPEVTTKVKTRSRAHKMGEAKTSDPDYWQMNEKAEGEAKAGRNRISRPQCRE